MSFRLLEGTGVPDRGQSTVLGIVLLIGMVATVSGGVLLVAEETTTDIQRNAEDARVESAFTAFSQEMETASRGSDSSNSIDIDVGHEGAVVREQSGRINVSSEALRTTALENITIGTVEYEGESGTTIAYEAGAVFRETGNETQVVSAPPIYYETATDTLTMPVMTATGERDLGSGDVRLEHEETDAFEEAAVVENESVTITIQSDYYRGWESFFRNQAGDTAVQEIDHTNRTVEVEVGYIDLENAFASGVTYSDSIEDFDNDFDDESREGNMPPMDPVIEEMVADAADDPNVSDHGTIDGSGSTVFEGGTHYADGVGLNGEDVTWDLDENATLIVDGDFTMNGDQWIVDTNGGDYVLRIYVTGNFVLHNGEMVPTSGGSAQNLQVYGTSDLDGDFHGGYFNGTFYAASDDWEGSNDVASGACSDYQLCFQSNPEFEGGLVVHSAKSQAKAVEFEYDDTLQGNEFDAYPDEYTLPPQLTYLNVAKHEIEIDQD